MNAGDHTRQAARLMSPVDRRIVIVSLYRRLADSAPHSPFIELLQALYFDLIAAEDEEGALAADIDT